MFMSHGLKENIEKILEKVRKSSKIWEINGCLISKILLDFLTFSWIFSLFPLVYIKS